MSEAQPLSLSGLAVRPCEPNERDAAMIMAWRNDPQTIAASFHRALKQWPSFQLEYQDTYFSQPDLPPHFVCLDGEPIAFLRYVPSASGPRVLDISFNIAPAFRGRRLAAPVLTRSLAFLRASGFNGWIRALVRMENWLSRRSFLAVGFREIDCIQHNVVDTGELCPVIRLGYAMTDGQDEGDIHSVACPAESAVGSPP